MTNRFYELARHEAVEGRKVGHVPARPATSHNTAKVGPVVQGSRLSLHRKEISKRANYGSSLTGFSSNMAPTVPAGRGAMGAGGGTREGTANTPYSPELSTDFLELPQSIDEMRNYFRFFYRTHPIVGQAIDIHTDLPLSKVRLARPDRGTKEIKEAAMAFCNQWVRDVDLNMRLEEILHEFNLLGEVYVFAEDINEDIPKEVTHDIQVVLDSESQEIREEATPYPDANERAAKWMRKHYRGWTNLRTLPPEQVHHEYFPFSGEALMEYIPDSKMKSVWERAMQGDAAAARIAEAMPEAAKLALANEGNIPLNSDPDGGSFCCHLANKRSQYEPRGHSRLERCLRTLLHSDKLRQAQASIASRHMTPIRLVMADGLNEVQVDELRLQIDQALTDPDYSIVTNFEVQWEEMNSNGRLLDLASEYDLINRELYAGLGVTESLLSGESSYSGDRINLEVINVRYMLVRQKLQHLVEEKFFKPMCRRMGFMAMEDDREFVVYPRLSFTRLSIRDTADTYDALFNLYTKGSVPVSTILDLLNVDSDTAREELERDFMTMNDPNFNEAIRNIYSRVGDLIGERSDAADKMTSYLGLKLKPEPEGGRF